MPKDLVHETSNPMSPLVPRPEPRPWTRERLVRVETGEVVEMTVQDGLVFADNQLRKDGQPSLSKGLEGFLVSHRFSHRNDRFFYGQNFAPVDEEREKDATAVRHRIKRWEAELARVNKHLEEEQNALGEVYRKKEGGDGEEGLARETLSDTGSS